jgi:gliding motility-associated lipoprotein GldH
MSITKHRFVFQKKQYHFCLFKYIVFLLLVTVIISCDEKRVYDHYASFGTEGWGKQNIVSFPFDISDTLEVYDLFIQLRNTNEYEYANLFLITELQFPDGFHVVDTLEYKMTDAYGYWLGTGFTDMKENKLFYKEGFKFPQLGNYEMHIQQAMRKREDLKGIEHLKGVSDVGFRIEKRN